MANLSSEVADVLRSQKLMEDMTTQALADERRWPKAAVDTIIGLGMTEAPLADRVIDGADVPARLHLREEKLGQVFLSLTLVGRVENQYVGEVWSPEMTTSSDKTGVTMPKDDGLYFREPKNPPELMTDAQKAFARSLLQEAVELNGIEVEMERRLAWHTGLTSF